MDSKQSGKSRTRKSVREVRSQGKVKTLIDEFTGIKRPSGKNRKLAENQVSERSKTLPRNKREVEENRKKSAQPINNGTKTVTRTSTFYDNLEKADELGEILRQRRSQIADNSNTNDNKPFTKNQITRKVSFKEDIKSRADWTPQFNENKTDFSVDNLEEEDIFGFNDFDEISTDNFIVESYNDEGRELIIITLEITRRSLPLNEQNDIQQLIDNSDIVIYEEKCKEKSSTSQTFEESEINSEENLYEKLNQKSEDEEELVTKLPKKNFEDSELGDNNSYYFSIDNLENHFYPQVSIEEPQTPTTPLTKKAKINYVIEEMIKTEELYIHSLRMAVKYYMPYIYQHTPPNLVEKTSSIFGNIEDIYEQAKQFFELLRESSNSADSIAQVFIDFASIFDLYPKYSKNKPTADLYIKQFDEIIKQRQRELDDKLGLASHLLTPIQRLGKYILMLENIQKELKKMNADSEKVNKAISVIRQVMRRGNDSIAIDSIKNCPLDLTLYGPFIMRQNFMMLKPKKIPSVVFLFEQVVVFTQKVTKNMEHFNYVDSIQMSDLSIAKYEDNKFIFHLMNFTKMKKVRPELATYVLEADSPKIKNDWTRAIEIKLWHQLEQAKNQQKKLNSDEGKRYSKYTQPGRTVLPSPKKSKSLKSSSRFYDYV